MTLNSKQIKVLGDALAKADHRRILDIRRDGEVSLADKSHFCNFKSGKRPLDDKRVCAFVTKLGINFEFFKNLSGERENTDSVDSARVAESGASEDDVFFKEAAALLWSYAGRETAWANKMTRLALGLIDRVISWKRDYSVRQLITIFDSLSSYIMEGRSPTAGKDRSGTPATLEMWDRWLVRVAASLAGLDASKSTGTMRGEIDRRIAIPWCYLLRIKALRHRRYMAVAENEPQPVIAELGQVIMEAFDKCLEVSRRLRLEFDEKDTSHWMGLYPKRRNGGAGDFRCASQTERNRYVNAVQTRLMHIAALENRARYLTFSADVKDVETARSDMNEALRLCDVASMCRARRDFLSGRMFVAKQFFPAVPDLRKGHPYILLAPYEKGSAFELRYFHVLADVKYTDARLKDYAGQGVAFSVVMEDCALAALSALQAYHCARNRASAHNNRYTAFAHLSALVRMLVTAERYAFLHGFRAEHLDRNKVPWTHELLTAQIPIGIKNVKIAESLPSLFREMGFSLPWDNNLDENCFKLAFARRKTYWDFEMYMWLTLEKLVRGQWMSNTRETFAKVVLLYSELTFDGSQKPGVMAQCRVTAGKLLGIELLRKPCFDGLSKAERLHLGIRILSEYEIVRRYRYEGHDNDDKIEPSGLVRWAESCRWKIGRPLDEGDDLLLAFISCVRADILALMRYFGQVGFAKFYRGVLRHEGEIPSPEIIVKKIDRWLAKSQIRKIQPFKGLCEQHLPKESCVQSSESRKMMTEKAGNVAVTADVAYQFIRERLPNMSNQMIAAELEITSGYWSKLRKGRRPLPDRQIKRVACILDVGVSDLPRLKSIKDKDDERRQGDAAFVKDEVLPELRSTACQNVADERVMILGLKSLSRVRTDFDRAFIDRMLGEYSAIEWERRGSNSLRGASNSWMQSLKELIAVGLCGSRADLTRDDGLRATVELMEISDRGSSGDVINYINKMEDEKANWLWTCTAIRLLSGVTDFDAEQKCELRRAHDRLRYFLRTNTIHDQDSTDQIVNSIFRSDLALVKMRSNTRREEAVSCFEELLSSVENEIACSVGCSAKCDSDAIVLLHLGRVCGLAIEWSEEFWNAHLKDLDRRTDGFAVVLKRCLHMLESSPAKSQWVSVAQGLRPMLNRVLRILSHRKSQGCKKVASKSRTIVV